MVCKRPGPHSEWGGWVFLPPRPDLPLVSDLNDTRVTGQEADILVFELTFELVCMQDKSSRIKYERNISQQRS